MKSLITLFLLPISILGWSQKVEVLTSLDSKLVETSGLVYLNGKLITHNDSGGKPILYEFDSVSGNVTRKVFVQNATNIDWEDLCADSTHIYIGDFGNNLGSRKDLVIYKISILDYLNSDTVSAEKIFFSYSDQKEFEFRYYQTNHDAETLISIKDSLYLFSKNWGDKKTRVYAIPKTQGTYSLTFSGQFKAGCFVTAGVYNPSDQSITLIGYSRIKRYVMRVDEFNGYAIAQGKFQRKNLKLPKGASAQIEGITHISNQTYYITAEEYRNNKQQLYKMDVTEIFPKRSKGFGFEMSF